MKLLGKEMNLENWLDKSTKRLKLIGIDSARLDALLLLEDALSKSRSWIITHPETLLSKSTLDSLEKKLSLRSQRMPLAYVRGVQEFYGRTFIVTPETLIPRPESEGMIELLKEVANKTKINTVIDLGTGSGILAITASLELLAIHVTASDISKEALKLAAKNAKLHDTHIRYVCSDLLENVPKMPKTRPYVVLANLPYVPEKLITSPEITKEPKLALFAGPDGMKIYKEFWLQIKNLKNKPNFIISESLESQHKEMVKMANDAGFKLVKSDVLAQLFAAEDHIS
jgi:release factor glutamine methyltransferase